MHNNNSSKAYRKRHATWAREPFSNSFGLAWLFHHCFVRNRSAQLPLSLATFSPLGTDYLILATLAAEHRS